MLNRSPVLTLCAAVLALAWQPAGMAAFVDPLDAPAIHSPLAAKSILIAVTRTPDGKWVAVGRRGHILLSADGQQWWQAASVPVSTDLVSVFFADAKHGWAVGHGGVILATDDGGEHWTKQFDGIRAAELLVKFYEPFAGSEDSDIAFAARDAARFKESGPGRPFLDIWFADAQHGYAIGAYNLLFVTEDGGRTWQPRPDMIRNEMGLHLSSIAAIGGTLYIAGEQGLLTRFDAASDKFVRMQTPYAGSFFGIAGKEGLLVVFGLQGNAFRSRDGGTTWERIAPGLAGTITSGTVLNDGRLVLASQSGGIAVSSDDGTTFTPVRSTKPMPIYAIAPAAGGIVVAGSRGAHFESLQPNPQQDGQHGG